MKHLLLVSLLFMTSSLTHIQPASTIAKQDAQQNNQATALCAPGIYLTQPGDCLPLGPSDYLTRMAQLGITFPLFPLQAAHTDPQLANVPYLYAQMQEGSASIYPTLEAAEARQSAVETIGPGKLKYLSYINTTESNGDLYFQLRSGGWVAASEAVAQRVSLPSSFRGGLLFQKTPEHSFGWIIPINPNVETKRTPGYANQDYTGHKINQYEIVQVYSVQRVGSIDWYMVGPDEWLEQRMVGRVIPNTKPPEGVTNGRWIEINLFEQTLAVYDHSQLVFATLVATGLQPFWTRPGIFQIQKKLESTPMSGAFEANRSDFYYLEDVPFTMYYDGARALHGAYWRHRLGFPQSHGCVNLSISDAHWLFNWANKGDWVYVWDPSGKTPTDPKAYPGAGAP